MDLENNNQIFISDQRDYQNPKFEPMSSERPINFSKNEFSHNSNFLIREYFVSPKIVALDFEDNSFYASQYFVNEGDSDGVSHFGTFNRPSLSKFSKRFVMSPTNIKRRTKKSIVSSLAHLSLQELILRQKLQQFVRYLRNHSGVNDDSVLNQNKLRIINDRGASENEILKRNSSRSSQKYTISPYAKNLTPGLEKRIRAKLHKASRRLINTILLWNRIFYSTLDENVPVFKPFGKFIIIWELLMLLMTSWNLVSFSLIFCFQITNQEGFSLSISFLNRSSAFSSFEILCLILYYLDVILKFNTSFYSDGEAVSDRRKIFRNYFKGGLAFDLLGTIPFWLYFIGVDIEGSLLLFFLLFKLYPLQLESVYQVIKLLLTVLIVCHIFACLWHYQAVEGGYQETNWVTKQGLSNHHWFERYVRSLYFTVVTMTTVGYGDISPSNTLEYVVAMACMFIGSGLIGYSVNSIGAILKKRNKSELEFRNKMQLINGYLKKNNVHESLKVRVRKYLEYIWKIENSEKEKKCEEILKELPNSLREELLIHSRLWTVQSLFAKMFREATVRRILNSLVHVQYSKEEWIFQEGENSENSLFLVSKGSVALLLNQGKPSKRKFIEIDSKKSGDHFDLYSFVVDTPKPYSAKATSVSSVFKLGRKEFIDILKENQEDYERFCMIRDKCLLNKELSVFGQRCKCCGEPNHLLLNCPYLCFQPFRTIVIRKHLHSKTQKRSKYKRKNKLFGSSSHGKCNTFSVYQDTKCSLKAFQDSNPELIKELEETNMTFQENNSQSLRFNISRSFSATIEEKMTESKDPTLREENNISTEEVNKKAELLAIVDMEISQELTESQKQNNKDGKLNPNNPHIGIKSGLDDFNFQKPHGEEIMSILSRPLRRTISHKKSNVHSVDCEHFEEEYELLNKSKKPPISSLQTAKHSKAFINENMFSIDMDKGHVFSIYLPDNNKLKIINGLKRNSAKKKKRLQKVL